MTSWIQNDCALSQCQPIGNLLSFLAFNLWSTHFQYSVCSILVDMLILQKVHRIKPDATLPDDKVLFSFFDVRKRGSYPLPLSHVLSFISKFITRERKKHVYFV